MDLHGGNDGIKTTIVVAEKMRSMLTLLGTNLPGCALMPLKKMSTDTVWSKASQVPNQKFSEVRKMMAFTGDLDVLLHRVPRNKGKKFSGVVLLGSPDALTEEELIPIWIDLADLHGIFIKQKQLQVKYSISNISFLMIPPNTDLDYCKEELQRTLSILTEVHHWAGFSDCSGYLTCYIIRKVCRRALCFSR